jgi:hypothetical protein
MTKQHATPSEPDPEDYAAVEREYGSLPKDASDDELVERYLLAVCNKIIRGYRHQKSQAQVSPMAPKIRGD